jgi:hypothetical protein
MIGVNGIAGSFFSRRHFEAVEFGHFHIEQDQIGPMLRDARQGFFAVARLQQFIAVRLKARDKNVAVGLVVVDDEDACWISHPLPPAALTVPERSVYGPAALFSRLILQPHRLTEAFE